MEISTTSDIEAFLRPFLVSFGLPPQARYVEVTSKLLNSDRAHIAYEDGTIVASAGAFTHTLAVPGGVVPAAAVFGVGVLPSHRRRGILTKLQETQLEDARRRGEHLAYLWASEGPIYRRFGYGMASRTMRVTIQTKNGGLCGQQNRSGTLRLLDRAECYERIGPIYNRAWRNYPGLILRSEDWWRLTRLGTPDLYQVVWEDSAYALYLVKMDTASVSGEIEVVEAISESIEGYRQIWRYLLDMDLMTTVSAANLPVDHPLVLMIEDPLKVKSQIHCGIWIRIIDVQAALRARALGAESVLIQVVDKLFPHNEGIWRVGADGVSRADTAPELVLDVGDLGSVYLGGFTFANLASSGRLCERVPGSVGKADRIFSWHCKPWCAQIF